MLTGAVLWLVAFTPAADGGEEPQEVRYDGHKVVRVDLQSQAELDRMLRISTDPWTEAVGVGPMDFRVSPQEMALLEDSGIDYDVLIENVQVLIDAERDRLAFVGLRGAGIGDWFAEFKDYDAVNTKLNELATLRPDLAEVINVGTSLEGRTINGIRITGPGTGKPPVLFNGCQHAREWIAVMVPMYIADTLINDYDTDPAIQDIVDRVEFFIVPIVNPDGYVYTWGPDRLWRKNRRDNGDGTFGVDLNRNWSVGWGGAGSSGITSSQTYRGLAAFSEPESSALRDLFVASPQMVSTIDFHSYSQLVLSPWGYTLDLTPDVSLYDELGSTMAQAILDVHGTTYIDGPAAITLYQASGISIDWTYGDQGTYSFTIELRPAGSSPGFILPPDQIIPTCEENLPAALHLTDWSTQGVDFTFPDGLPNVIEAETLTPITVNMTPISSGPLQAGSARLYARIGTSGPFVETLMTDLGGNLYEGILPATPCGSPVQFYFLVESTTGTAYTSPDDAPPSSYEADAFEINVVFEDNGEADLGWTVSGDASDGHWDRGVPVGGGDRGDPPTDGDGSGSCYLTDNVEGNSDVDNGSTTLTSPVMDASTRVPILSYYRWFSNSSGGGAFEDVFVVEVSYNAGASWLMLETVGPSGLEVSGGWFHKEWTLADVLGFVLTDQFQVRFTASDLGAGSVVEAGVDGVKLFDLGCTVSCPADINGDLVINVLDLIELLVDFGTAGGPSDINADGDVNVLDLIELLLVFGTACP